jgi:hypothetical protein
MAGQYIVGNLMVEDLLLHLLCPRRLYTGHLTKRHICAGRGTAFSGCFRNSLVFFFHLLHLGYMPFAMLCQEVNVFIHINLSHQSSLDYFPVRIFPGDFAATKLPEITTTHF